MQSPPPSDWSLRVTENLFRQQDSSTPLSNDRSSLSTPPPQSSTATTPTPEPEKPYNTLVSPLPSNAVVIQPTDQESSFNHYINTEFEPHSSAVLRNRLSEASIKRPPAAAAVAAEAGPSQQPHVHNKVSGSTLRDGNTTITDDATLTAHWADFAKDLEAKGITSSAKGTKGYQFNATEISTAPAPWWVAPNDEDGFWSIGALLFLFGFICPVLWWLGAFWPRRPRERGGKMAERWQYLNRIMSIGFSVILILAIIIAVAVWKATN